MPAILYVAITQTSSGIFSVVRFEVTLALPSQGGEESQEPWIGTGCQELRPHRDLCDNYIIQRDPRNVHPTSPNASHQMEGSNGDGVITFSLIFFGLLFSSVSLSKPSFPLQIDILS